LSDAPAAPRLGRDELAAACWAEGIGGLVPHPEQSLAMVPAWVLDQLQRARRGVIVLAVDGLSWRVAATSWRSVPVACLTSTFPTTSTTAWMTAMTGVGPAGHLVAGVVYLVPEAGALCDAVTGEPAGGSGAVLVAHPTLFERAADLGAACLAITRELDGYPGPWTGAVLRGAVRLDGAATVPARLAAQVADPGRLGAAVIADVDAALAGPPAGTTLLWVYVNLDDYVHRHGYDGAVPVALEALEAAALRWADAGWTVVAHADHGQVRCVRDPELEAAWAAVDTPALCEFPAGGAGRTRWLYPLRGRAGEVAERLRLALGPQADVRRRDELVALGLLPPAPRLLERIGEVVALAAGERFPLPAPRGPVFHDHGGLDPDEMLVPLTTWPSS
jgi:hypothetical protein